MLDFSYPTAFVVGLLGGTHCVGMCGGIVGVLTLGLPQQKRNRLSSMLTFQLAYNLGRVCSYVLAGAIMGALGMVLSGVLPVYQAQQILLVFAGIFMVLLGLYLSGWWLLLNRLEHLGGRLWRHIEPLGRRLLPVQTQAQALLVGVVWGWLPCGLVYSMLVNAMSTGSALKGALLMLSFALGTLPTMMTVGALAGAASRLTRSASLRRVAGALVILFGLYTLWRAL